jgi:hypothetical protein
MPKDNIKLVIKKISFMLAIIALSIILLIFSFVLINNLHTVSRQEVSIQHKTVAGLLFNRQKMGAITAADVNYIDYWMTFRYINIIFKLPDDYLKNYLNITDKIYPNISLGKYTSMYKINRTLFIAKTKQAVSAYLEINQTQK